MATVMMVLRSESQAGGKDSLAKNTDYSCRGPGFGS